MDYLGIKHIHMGLALLSVGGFMLRWAWRMKGRRLAYTRVARVVPHVIDTLLLATAGIMIVTLGQVPVSGFWLTAKIGGLLVYIVFGMMAMHSAPDKARSLPAFIAALAVFGWIASVAISKSPLGFFRYLAT